MRGIVEIAPEIILPCLGSSLDSSPDSLDRQRPVASTRWLNDNRFDGKPASNGCVPTIFTKSVS